MDPVKFAQLAIQMLSVAQIPGAVLDDALAFRTTAERIASGELLIVPRPAEEPAPTEQ